jgi:hypothetical protein
MDSRMDGDWRSKEIIYERKREKKCVKYFKVCTK